MPKILDTGTSKLTFATFCLKFVFAKLIKHLAKVYLVFIAKFYYTQGYRPSIQARICRPNHPTRYSLAVGMCLGHYTSPTEAQYIHTGHNVLQKTVLGPAPGAKRTWWYPLARSIAERNRASRSLSRRSSIRGNG